MKKLIALVLIFLTILSNCVFAKDYSFENVENDSGGESIINLSMELNDSNLNMKSTNKVSNYNKYNTNNKTTFNVNIVNNETAEGKLTINNIIYDVVAEGELKRYTVIEDNDYAFGVFNGYIKKGNRIIDEVIFDIHYDIYNKTYKASSMTIGVIENENDEVLSLYFGDMDDNLNKMFFETYVLNKNHIINKNMINNKARSQMYIFISC